MVSAVNRAANDLATRMLIIAENNWLNGGLLDTGWSKIINVGLDSLQADIAESLSIVKRSPEVDQVLSFLGEANPPQAGHSEHHPNYNSFSYSNLRLALQLWSKLKNTPKTFNFTDPEDIRLCLFNLEPHDLPLEASFVKSVLKDHLFSQRSTLPHYCVGAANKWIGDTKAFLHTTPSLTFYLGPYMGLSIGHLDYILFSVVAVSLMRKEGINARLVLIGSYQLTPLWPVISLLIRHDYITLLSISSMTLVDYVGYMLRGDTCAFFHLSKFLEHKGIGSTMGFGYNVSLNELRGIQPLEEIRIYSQNMHGSLPRYGFHSRTSFYKRDAHMNFRNSSPANALSALARSGISKSISLIGVYSPDELDSLESVAANYNVTLDSPTDLGFSDILYACGCDEFVGTSSGPAHFVSYFGNTLFLNSTTFHVTNLAVSTTVVSFSAVTLTALAALRLTKMAFVELLLSDSLGTYSNFFQVSPLNEQDIYDEICSWRNKEYVPLSSIREFASLGIVYADVNITMRTKSMFEDILSRLLQ